MLRQSVYKFFAAVPRRTVPFLSVLAFLFSARPAHAQPLTCFGDHLFYPARPTGQIRATRMDEIAGIAAGRLNAVLWLHNDGGINRLFATDLEGRDLGNFTLGQTVVDAEDLAAGPGPLPGVPYLYLADIGNEQKSRESIAILRLPEPLVELNPDPIPTIALANLASFALKYPDGSHDANGLLVDPRTGDLVLVTREPGRARLYLATQSMLQPGRTNTLIFSGEIAIEQVTGADVSLDGSLIIVRNEKSALVWSRAAGQSLAAALAGQPWPAPLSGEEMKGQDLAFDASDTGYFTIGSGEEPPIFHFARNYTGYSTGQSRGSIADLSLSEISGLAASRQFPNVLWVHNDGANRRVAAVTPGGTTLAVFQFSEDLLDFEDIAIGPGPEPNRHYLYAGDIGDNNALRQNVRVFRAVEPSPLGLDPGQVKALEDEAIITLRYPDGAHDAEALMVDPITGDLLIVTKLRGEFGVYSAPAAALRHGADIELTHVFSGSLGSVSGADISADGRQILLRREESARLWQRAEGQSIGNALAGVWRQAPVIGPPVEPNGEGISFQPDGRGYYTISEEPNPDIYHFVSLMEPRFSAPPELTANGWKLSIRGCDGSVIQVEASTDLRSWRRLGAVAPENGSAVFTDPEKSKAQFYRLRLGE